MNDMPEPRPSEQFDALCSTFEVPTPFFEIVNSAPAAIWILRPDLTAVFMNQACVQYIGSELSALLGFGWSAALHLEDRETCLDTLRRCVREGRPVTHECRIRRAEGVVGWVRIHAAPRLSLNTGEVIALIVTGTDISAYRRVLIQQSVTAERLHLAVTGSSDGVWDWPDVSQGSMWWSPRCYTICGYEPDEIESDVDNFFALVHQDDALRVRSLLERAIASMTSYEAELRIRTKDGGYRWCRGRAETSGAGTKIRMSGTLQDIHPARAAADEIALLQERYERAEAGSTNGLWEWDLITDRMWYSDNLKEMLGFSALESLATTQRSFAKLFHPNDSTAVATAIAAHLRDRAPLDVDFRVLNSDGEAHWFRSRAKSQRVENGKVVRLSGSLYDVHELKVAQLALQDEREKIQSTLSSLGEPVITTDPFGQIDFINHSAEHLFGLSPKKVLKQRFEAVFEFRNHDSRAVTESPVAQCLSDASEIVTGEAQLHLASKAEYAVEFTARKIRSATGRVFGAVAVIRDVTEKRRQADEISHLAKHDALTGLVNRYEFERRLTRLIAQPLHASDMHAMMFLDLDRFKFINDTCGHAAGDELLRHVASLMRGEVRRRDTVARLGGDEFAVLLEHCDRQQAERVAHSIRERLGSYSFPWQTRHFSIGVSIGLLMIDALSGSLSTILQNADVACYAAKKFGRNRVYIFGSDELPQRPLGKG
ncbi:MAG: PAS domain-containing protein [Gammaproteobacteria bacterium]|nr:PAS domain-containing protein [Gammaproteobacteria bacterium]